MVKKGLLIALTCLMCISLSSCAALSALKSFAGSGDSADSSVNVEANVAARDNKKAVFSSESNRSYANKGNVTQNGVKFKEGSFTGLILASGMGGIDLVMALLIVCVTVTVCFYFWMRQKNTSEKIRLKLKELKFKK